MIVASPVSDHRCIDRILEIDSNHMLFDLEPLTKPTPIRSRKGDLHRLRGFVRGSY